MSVFDQDFLDTLPTDPKIGLFNICQKLLTQRTSNGFNHQHCMDAFALIDVYISKNELEFTMPVLSSVNQADFDKKFVVFIQTLKSQLQPYVVSDKHERKLHNLRSGFSNSLNKAPSYEFTEGDFKRIQGLLNGLREYLTDSDEFTPEHKRRLLMRVEKLQAELHKKQSDFDHYWGLFVECGIAIGKFGKEAKPFVDMVREIKEIIWSTQSRAEELSSDAKPPMLDSE